MSFRRPYLLRHIPSDVSEPIAQLVGLEGFARSILVGILPLMALQAFGNKEAIASVYFISTVFTLLLTINLDRFERWLTRSRLLTLGGIFIAVSAGLFYSRLSPLYSIGLAMRATGSTIFSVCISLYIMDFIGKTELARAESRRAFYLGGSWFIGPVLGAWLFENVSETPVFVISAASVILMLIYFWNLRWGNNQVIKVAASQSPNPLRAIRRYASQPRLRRAYVITLTRSIFWNAVFVYGPIYVIDAGLPAWIGGALLSICSSLLLFSPYIRDLAYKYGSRQVMMTSALLIAVTMLTVGALGPARPIGLLFLAIGAIGGMGLDVLSNIPFMRMVRPKERTEMTMIFSTWREVSGLVTQAIAFLVIQVAPFWIFWIIVGLIQFVAIWSMSFLPRRI